MIELLRFSNYRKGANFERLVKRLFEAAGATVFRCAGSKPLDLVVIWPNGVTDFVECKSYSNLWSTDIKKVAAIAADMNRKVIFANKEGSSILYRIIGPDGIEGIWEMPEDVD